MPDELPTDLFHQVRQIAAGLVGIVIACWDRWRYPEPQEGFTINIDELVLLVSLGVLAGAAGLFRFHGAGSGVETPPPKIEAKAPAPKPESEHDKPT